MGSTSSADTIGELTPTAIYNLMVENSLAVIQCCLLYMETVGLQWDLRIKSDRVERVLRYAHQLGVTVDTSPAKVSFSKFLNINLRSRNPAGPVSLTSYQLCTCSSPGALFFPVDTFQTFSEQWHSARTSTPPIPTLLRLLALLVR